MDTAEPPSGRHRRPDASRPAAVAVGGRHRAATASPTRPGDVPTPRPEAAEPATPVDTRSADLARFLAAAREQSTAPLSPGDRRIGRRAIARTGRSRRALVIAVAAVGIGAAGWGLHRSAATPARPSLGGTGVAAVTPVAPPPRDPTAVATVPQSTPTPTAPATPTAAPPVAVVASRPPVEVSEVPVVPVPATAAIPSGAAVEVPGRPAVTGKGSAVTGKTSAAPGKKSSALVDKTTSWHTVVGRLFTARSTAFTTGDPALLTRADAPGSPLLHADRQVFDRVLHRAGFTRAAGLGFDLDRVRVVSAGARVVRLTVVGRQLAYVLTGPGGTRSVATTGRRDVAIELTRASASAPWLMATGAAAPA